MRLAFAYLLTFRVLASYAWLRLWRPIIGAGLHEARLAALHRRNARRVERGIIRLGGLFVKVGQLISILTNFLPEEFRRELEGLQDQLPARPTDEVMRTLRQELHRPIEELFAEFDPVPLASASLAQVHRATLLDGRRVAVKVQHADIDTIARMDLHAIRRILGIVQWVTRVRGLESYHAEVSQMIAEELDFQQEARHIATIAASFVDDPLIDFPTVVPERSTRRVLTTTLMHGTKVSAVAALDAQGIDRAALAHRLLTAYCRMIFVDGVYHADPHPGNLLVRDDGGIVFLDFGAVGRLSPAMKAGIPVFLEGVIRRDPAQITAAMRSMGFVARNAAADDVAERVIEYVQRRVLDEVTIDSWKLDDIEFDVQRKLEMFGDLRRLDVSFRQLTSTFQVPRDWVLLERTLLLLLGLCTHLDRRMNPMRVIRPYLEEFVLGRERDWGALVRTSVKDMALAALAIPDGVNRLLARANRGELEVRTPDVRAAAALVYRGMRQLVYALFTASGGLLAYLADGRGEVALARGALAVGAAFALLLVGSILSTEH